MLFKILLSSVPQLARYSPLEAYFQSHVLPYAGSLQIKNTQIKPI